MNMDDAASQAVTAGVAVGDLDREVRLYLAAQQGLPPGVEVFARPDFWGTRWVYRSGQHVTVLGPTGSGKTELAYEALGASATPKLPALVLVVKPRDTTVTKWSKAHRFRRVPTWPPPPNVWQPRNPPGYVIWPKHTFDIDRDEYAHHAIMRKAIDESYKKGQRILFADETYALSHELDLERNLNRVWTKGRSMDCGLWAASQRPAHIPLNAYSQAEHLFIAHDPDKRARDRYAEIGGVDPQLVKDITMRLGKYQFLYIRREGARLCVIDR